MALQGHNHPNPLRSQIVEMSVEITFHTGTETKENFDCHVIANMPGIYNYFIRIHLQTQLLNHGAIDPFPPRLVVKS